MLDQPRKPESLDRPLTPEHARTETQVQGVDTKGSRLGLDASTQAAHRYLPDLSIVGSDFSHRSPAAKGINSTVAGDSPKPISGDSAKPNGAIESHLSSNLTDRVVGAVSGSEGSFTTITRNDNGHGVSVGIRQWNQKVGELPNLLKSMHDANPEKFDQTFGRYSHNLQSESWVRHANMAGNRDLMDRMKTAMADPEFQKVQVEKAREFTNRTMETAKNFGFHSDLGKALVTDLSNQLGEAGARNLMRRAGLHKGGTIDNEEAMIKRLGNMSHRPNNRTRFELLASSFSPQRQDPRIHMDDTQVNLV